MPVGALSPAISAVSADTPIRDATAIIRQLAAMRTKAATVVLSTDPEPTRAARWMRMPTIATATSMVSGAGATCAWPGAGAVLLIGFSVALGVGRRGGSGQAGFSH